MTSSAVDMRVTARGRAARDSGPVCRPRIPDPTAGSSAPAARRPGGGCTAATAARTAAESSDCAGTARRRSPASRTRASSSVSYGAEERKQRAQMAVMPAGELDVLDVAVQDEQGVAARVPVVVDLLRAPAVQRPQHEVAVQVAEVRVFVERRQAQPRALARAQVALRQPERPGKSPGVRLLGVGRWYASASRRRGCAGSATRCSNRRGTATRRRSRSGRVKWRSSRNVERPHDVGEAVGLAFLVPAVERKDAPAAAERAAGPRDEGKRQPGAFDQRRLQVEVEREGDHLRTRS